MGKNKGGARVRVKQQHAPVNPLAGLTIPPEEMIHFPPKPDSNTSYPWPLLESMSMDWSKFQAIYPTYLDSAKTIKMGRRIAASDAVDQPTVQEIGEALRLLRLRHVVQPFKGYSRDTESRWDNPGRVLVDMKGDIVPNLMPGVTSDENLNLLMANDEISSKTKLLRKIASIIPNLDIRIRRLEEKKRQEEEEKKRSNELALLKSKSISGTGSKASTSSRKKKGKKKR